MRIHVKYREKLRWSLAVTVIATLTVITQPHGRVLKTHPVDENSRLLLAIRPNSTKEVLKSVVALSHFTVMALH